VIGILVHGGAGRIAPEREEAALAGCRAAAEVGVRVLAAGGSALDAAQAAVRALEDDPAFNAGVGAVLTRDGTVELDAALMDGHGLRVGAVAAVPDLRQPIDLARAVLDDGEHVILAGPAAWTFARERGVTPAPAGAMVTERSRQRWAEERARRGGAGAAVGAVGGGEVEGGTVGAVAIDAHGHVAAATSTGGINYKRPGRIGDTPVPGAGTWADDRTGAVSATGDGEAILRVCLARQLADRLEAGAAPEAAATAALADLVARTGGSAGVICVDRAGEFVADHASETMPVALAAVAPDGAEPRVIALLRPAGVDLAAALAAG